MMNHASALPTLPYNSNERQNYNSEESSSGSTCCSCCDDSEGSIQEWDSSVQENGELFYIQCSPLIQDSYIDTKIPKPVVTRSKSNKFSTFLRKRKQKKPSQSKQNVDSTAVHEKSDSTQMCPEFQDLSEHNVAVLFLNLSNVDNCDSSSTKDIYYFPQSAEKNVINLIKGALVTLYHLLPKLISETPESSTIFIKEELVNVVYLSEENDLLILACPVSRCSIFELKQFSLTIKHCLNYKYRSLHECFLNSANHASLNHLFGNLFIKLLRNSDEKFDLKNMIKGRQMQFEETFMLPRSLSISSILKAKIDDKLNELESNDFGDLSEDHYGCQRLFTIIGTCLYSNGYLISSHLQNDDLVNVHSYLRLNDILDLTVTSVMESLVIWQEVHLSSFLKSALNSHFQKLNRRWFMLITGKDQSLLIALLETGGCSLSQIGPCRPDELYVEQVQDTLTDILHFGLSEEMEQYCKSSTSLNSRPPKCSPAKLPDSSQNTLPLYPTLRKSVELHTSLNFENENISNTNSASNPELSKKKGGRPASKITLFFVLIPAPNKNGYHEDTFSESMSRAPSSAFSDEPMPVLGRRAQRLQRNNISSGSIYTLSQSNASDSDHSDYETTGSSHSSSFIENRKVSKHATSSRKILHGDEKALFYYVTLHSNRGVILCSGNPTYHENSQKYHSIINNFKFTAQKIHSVLAHKKMSAVGKYQRSTLPVKEYGLLFEFDPVVDEDKDRKSNSIIYWVVGRAFNKPELDEIYVCYEDKTPQNLVEIAFRLAMIS